MIINKNYKKKYVKYLNKDNLLNFGGNLDCVELNSNINDDNKYMGNFNDGFYNKKNETCILIEKTKKGNPLEIGTGSQGSIYKGYLVDKDKIKYDIVIKKIFLYQKSEIKNICRELSVLQKLNNENVVKYYGYSHEIIDDSDEIKKSLSHSGYKSQSQLSLSASESEFDDNIPLSPSLSPWSLSSSSLKLYEKSEYIYLFMEYINGITLEKYIENMKQNNNINYDKILIIALKLIEGLKYIHSLNIVHRDIKPLNIMMSDNIEPSKIVVKYIDFGISCIKDKNCDKDTSGTQIYMSPELYNNEINVDLFKNDIWSLGITLYNLLSLNKLINVIENDAGLMQIPLFFTKISQNEKIINNVIDETKLNISELNKNKFIEILKNLLQINPDERKIINF